jgi:hypothetical protein
LAKTRPLGTNRSEAKQEDTVRKNSSVDVTVFMLFVVVVLTGSLIAWVVNV